MHYLELILYRTYADLKAEAARGYLGVLWWVIEPLLYLGMFSFFFIYVRGQHSSEVVAFLLVGLVVWKWFASSLPSGAKSIISGGNLMRQVYLPKYIFPCVAVLTNTIKFLIVLLLLLAALLCAGIRPSASWLALPVLIAVQFCLTLGIAGLLGALVPFLPDLQQIINNMLMFLFFLSGVIFDINKLPEPFRAYLSLNPMAMLIANYRTVLIDGRTPSWLGLAAALALACALCAVAGSLLRRYDRIYPKVLIQ